MEHLVQLVSKDYLVLQDEMVNQGHREHLAPQAPMVEMVILDNKVNPEHPV